MDSVKTKKVTIALPVLNEEGILADTVEKVRTAAAGLENIEAVVVIADNDSNDATERIGRELAATRPNVRYLRLAERGKGRAIRAAWEANPADIYVFMDADLSTDLAAFPSLIGAVAYGGADMAIGSRRHKDSKVVRSLLRRFTSLCYSSIVHLLMGTKIKDLPCGFKAVSALVVREILPTVKDEGWFFDSELLLRAEHHGLAIHEIPIVWRDDLDRTRKSKVSVFRLGREYFRKVLALRRDLGKK